MTSPPNIGHEVQKPQSKCSTIYLQVAIMT